MKNSKQYASKTLWKDWEAIDWHLVQQKVRTLQARIVKATKRGQYRKIQSLQWVLTQSFHAKLLAVKRVTSNTGRNTPGVDGAIWSTNPVKWKAARSLQRKGYRPSPLRRVKIPKANGKYRSLAIPCMKDRAMQALYQMALDPVAETQADLNSYGFRPKRACADAVQQCFNTLAAKAAPQWVLEADIKGCFDNISHQWLLQNIPMDKRVLRQWLDCKIIDGKSFFYAHKGTPQGGIISPVLANMVLNGLEGVLNQLARKTFCKRGYVAKNRFKVNFVRYADDFIVTANDKEFLQQKIIPTIEEFLRPRGLSLSKEKTRITHIEQGFDFLGQNVRKYNGKLLIKPAKGNLKAVKQKLKKTIMTFRAFPQPVLIYHLNRILRGWANYHRYVVAKQTFIKLDHHVFSLLWYWAKRRHSRKSRAWVRHRFFATIRRDRWVFCCVVNGKTVRLFKSQSIPIRRYAKIRFHANPYDPDWCSYFDCRKNPLYKFRLVRSTLTYVDRPGA